MIFDQGFVPLAFAKPMTIYKTAVSVPWTGPSLGTISRVSWTQIFCEVFTLSPHRILKK